MKKLIYSIGIFAVAAFAFSACQKEQSVKDELPGNNLVTVSFTAEKAGLSTKTAAVESSEVVSYNWTSEDVSNMKLFIVGEDGEGKETLTPVANPTVTKVSDTELTISGQVAPDATYVFRAVLSGSWTNDGTKPRLSDNQNPSVSNFDPNADVLVSEDKEVVVGASENTTVSSGTLTLAFRRLAVVNKMTLKNLKSGEKISKVVITSSKNLAGYFATNTLTSSGDKKVITLHYTNATVPSDGQFPVYFTTIEGSGHVLTVEVTTDQFIYTKSFAEGKSIDFNVGQFTKFNFALLAGVANTALVLPVEDDMSWAVSGTDAPNELTAAELTATQGTKKIYDSSTKAYLGVDGLKLGSSSAAGSITTNAIDLSSAFYIAIDAKTYSTDATKLKIQVDGDDVYTSTDALSSDFETYYVNCAAATSTSTVTITVNGSSKQRCYIKNLVIGSGTYVAPPTIKVDSSNPLEVANTGGSQSISYSIDNPSSGVNLTATTEATWIKNLNYATYGSVTFDVDPQETAAAAREAEIVLSYTGAASKIVTVNQAAGEGGVSTYKYIFTSTAWNATLNDAPANWTNDKSGSATGDARGISIQKAATGAGATSPVSYTSISNITISLSKSSNGVGSVSLYVGETQVATRSSFTTTATEYSFDVSDLSGSVSFVVNCSTSTLYVRDISITAAGIAAPKVATPTFNITDSNVSIVCDTQGATIYYTVDGSDPTSSSDVYSAAVDLSGSQEKTIKAFATKPGYDDSEIASKTYYAINVNSSTNGTVSARPFAAENDEISLTITPVSGYKLDELTVNDSLDQEVEVTNNKFTMPASPVTVNATFAEDAGGGDTPTPQEVTLQYTATTTTNMTGSNDAATLGLDASKWSVVGAKGGNSNFPGLNKAHDIRLYWTNGNSNTITVSSLVSGVTINYITITYTDTNYSNGIVLVGDNEVSLLNGVYPINSSSFVITNGNTTNVQVRISSIVINYTPSN